MAFTLRNCTIIQDGRDRRAHSREGIVALDFSEIRKLTIVALFSDDKLMEQLVLKGGNAISLVFGYGARSSLDLDFSIEGDFADFENAQRRIFAALKDRFSSAGIEVFDEHFERKPARQPNQPDWWGGYELSFKIIERRSEVFLRGDLAAMRRSAATIGPSQQRVFRVQISRFEYCKGKIETEFDNYTIYVYTPAMIIVEKLRAICQQMPEYEPRVHSTARARDFYDIHLVMTSSNLRFTNPDCIELIPPIFQAKKVPLHLIAKISEQREFHRPDWPAVRASVPAKLEEFDFYFDFVVEQTLPLKSLWEE